MTYWIERDGARRGPYQVSVLRQMVSAGSAHLNDLVWTEGTNTGVLLSEVLPEAPRENGGATGAASQWPMPPVLHWAAVMGLGIVTIGLFVWVWLFVQARFARKLDPANRSTILLAGCLMVYLAYLLMNFVVALTVARGGEATDLSVMGPLLTMWAVLFGCAGIFQMRSTFTKHYTIEEPFGLQLNPVLTLIFHVYYFQYHLSRIAGWKQAETMAR